MGLPNNKVDNTQTGHLLPPTLKFSDKNGPKGFLENLPIHQAKWACKLM